MSLEEFLLSRNISDEIIQEFKDENIDTTTILLMSDEDLKKYIPKFGDRAAVKNFCKRNNYTGKMSLIEKLRLKIDLKNMNTKKKRVFNRKKSTRVVEIGWMCSKKNEKLFRQVRCKAGGGTRRISMDRNSKCEEVLHKAKNLFFPNGVSPKGRLDNFNIELLDYKSHKFDLDLTIQEMYDISALSTLRFYLATTYKEDIAGDVQNDEDYIPATVTSSSESYSSERVLRGNSNSDHSSPVATFFHNFNEPDDTPAFTPEGYNLVSLDVFDTRNIEPITDQNRNSLMKILRVRRGKIFEEFIDAADILDAENEIKIEMVLPNGQVEFAEDFGGVFRDAISEFWLTFYDKCTMGANVKVPYLRHDFGEKQWKAIAMILIKGFQLEGYMPIQLAPVFFENCFGTVIEDEVLIQNFLEYISESEADTVKTALRDFDSVDKEDLLDFCSSYDAKWIPSSQNIKQLVRDISQKELIQKPAFVAKCFSFVFSQKMIFPESITDSYKILNPTVKNCLKKIEVNDNQEITTEKTTVFGYLKKFIKESDTKTRMAFFRYCTDADLPIKNINVSFINSLDWSRAPIAHTCSGLLELPFSYENYITFRSVFNNLLNSNIWIMDIV